MKKTLVVTISSLIVVFIMSMIFTNLFIPFFNYNKRTYSSTNCLTDSITDDMDVYDIARLYRDGHATMAVIVTGQNTSTDSIMSSRGSGVCIASNGYKTSLSSEYCASKGSYIVTNYHVVSLCLSDEFQNCTISVMPEDEEYYSSKLLWANQNLDVAVLYCEENFNYVTMKDRSIYCTDEEKLDFEQIFTVGTPLELAYLNRLTIGNVASNNEMLFCTTKSIYPYSDSIGNISYTDYPSYHNSLRNYSVLNNLYEDVIDITLGMSPGNSGGGCFDKNGLLIGLTTLGANVNETNGNQMNGLVPIYPITEVLDRLIENNETQQANKIFTFDEIGIKGLDAFEAYYASYIRQETKYSNYYLNGVLYANTSSNEKIFSFEDDGYYIISSTSFGLSSGTIITGCTIDEKYYEILDRNDLIYALLKIKENTAVKFDYITESGNNASKTITM